MVTQYSGWSDSGRIFESKQWDGSDFFMIWPLPAFIFVTDRVKEFIQENNLQGGVFKELHEIGEAKYGIGPGTPFDWFEPQLAKKRAVELGLE